MPRVPDFGPFVWSIAFAVAIRAGVDVGQAWAVADEAWQRFRERFNSPTKAPGRPHLNVKRRKK